MKWLLLLTGIVAVVALMAGCGGPGPASAPSVEYVAIQEGARLRLSWSAVEDAEGYKIYVDGVEVADITALSYDVAGPAKRVGVSAYGSGEETNQWTLDVSPEVTENLVVYGRSDPDPNHPSGFGFATDGTAVAYALSDTTNWPRLDFFLEDVAPTPLSLWSPHHRNYNTKENASLEATTTDFDALDIADSGVYGTQTVLSENAVYSLWVDPNANGWDATDDHFGKVKIVAISGVQVTMRVAYQNQVNGLRWVMTP